MDKMAVLLACSALVLKLVDIFKTIVQEGDLRKIAKMLFWTVLAMGLGCMIAFGGPFDMFKEVFGFDFTWVWVGRLFTGLAIGAGGSVIYDFSDKYFA